MADATRTRISIIREQNYGVLPTSPVMQQIRFNSSNLSTSINSVTSDEIDDTRNISDLSMVGIENGGDLTAELSTLSHDELIAGAMFNNWEMNAELINKAANVPIESVSGSVISVTAGGDDFLSGQLVRLQGFDNPANNVRTSVVSSTATSITVAATLQDQTSVGSGAKIKMVGVSAAEGDLSLATVPNRLVSAASLDFTDYSIEPGVWIKLNGFSVNALNGFYRVIGVSESTLTFDIVPSGFVANAGTAQTVNVFLGDYIHNGTTKLSYSIEQLYLDNTPEIRQMFSGVRIGTMEMSLESQAIVGMTFGTMGSESDYLDAAPSGQTYWREPLTEVLNTSANVGRIAEDGVPLAGTNCIMSASINIDNNLRGKTCIGKIGYVDIGTGRCNVTGSLNTYFGNKDIAEKIVNNEESGVDFIITGSDGGTILVDIPRLKFSEGSTPITGIDTDVMLDASYQGLRHPVFGYTIQMQRFAAIQ